MGENRSSKRGVRPVGFGPAHVRPCLGLRVRMAPGMQDFGIGAPRAPRNRTLPDWEPGARLPLQAHARKLMLQTLRGRLESLTIRRGVALTGTVTAVRTVGFTHPACHVRFDGGRTIVFFTGASISRGGAIRGQHPNRPRHSEAALLEYIKEQGWDPAKLAGMSINEVKALEPAHLADIVGAPVNKQQLVRLGGFCDQALCENAGEVVATAKGAGHDLRWLGAHTDAPMPTRTVRGLAACARSAVFICNASGAVRPGGRPGGRSPAARVRGVCLGRREPALRHARAAGDRAARRDAGRDAPFALCRHCYPAHARLSAAACARVSAMYVNTGAT